MATLEELEERVAELERVVLPVLRREQIDTRPVEDRLNTLRQQIVELQRRLSAQEQATDQSGQQLGQRFDRLEKALIYQFNAINQYITTRFDEQTAAIRAQFENTNMPLGRIVGLVDFQEKDIREMKADVGVIKEQIAEVRQDVNSRFEQMDQRFEATNQQIGEVRQEMNGRFEATNQQIIEVRQDMNNRFDLVLQQLAAITTKLDQGR